MLRQEFETLVPTMKPNQCVIYHTGNLMADRCTGVNFMAVDNTATAAWHAMEAGKVFLAQKRLVDGEIAYCAIKRTPPYKKVEWSGCYHPGYIKPVKPIFEYREAA